MVTSMDSLAQHVTVQGDERLILMTTGVVLAVVMIVVGL